MMAKFVANWTGPASNLLLLKMCKVLGVAFLDVLTPGRWRVHDSIYVVSDHPFALVAISKYPFWGGFGAPHNGPIRDPFSIRRLAEMPQKPQAPPGYRLGTGWIELQ